MRTTVTFSQTPCIGAFKIFDPRSLTPSPFLTPTILPERERERECESESESERARVRERYLLNNSESDVYSIILFSCLLDGGPPPLLLFFRGTLVQSHRVPERLQRQRGPVLWADALAYTCTQTGVGDFGFRVLI
jgi:hypothetical protein